MQWGYTGSLGMLEYEVMRSPSSAISLLITSQGVASVWGSLDLSRPLAFLDEIYKKEKLNRRLANQHWARWQSLGDTPRQAQEPISGHNLGAKTKDMFFSRTQSRAVIGLLTDHNTLRRHLYLPGLLGSPLRRRCGKMEETSTYILCECEALASLRHAYLGSFSLEPKDIQSISLEAI